MNLLAIKIVHFLAFFSGIQLLKMPKYSITFFIWGVIFEVKPIENRGSFLMLSA